MRTPLRDLGVSSTFGTIISAIGLEFGLRTIIEGAIVLVALLLLREELFQKLGSLWR